MKQQIPRLARDVLARQTAADAHPSADLLSGFMEHELNAEENARVTTHLAGCADCREIVFLASAATPEEQRAVAAAAYVPAEIASVQKRRFRWLSWKWMAPSLAALVVVAGVVVQHVTRTQGNATQTVAMNAPSSLPTPPAQTNALSATIAESQTASPAPPNISSDKKSKAEEEAWRREMQAKRELELRNQLSGSLMIEQHAQLAPPEVAARAFAFKGAAGAAPRSSAQAAATQAALPSAVPQPMAKAAAPQAAARTDAAQSIPAASQSVEVTAAAPLISGGPITAAPPAAAKAEPSAQSNLAVPPNAPSGGNDLTYMQPNLLQDSGNDVTYIASAAQKSASPLRWRITDDGRLQRAAASGQWTPVLADQPVSFHTVAVLGTDVWAGGSDGALFHSTDAGEHWTRVALVANGQPAHGTIRSIRFDKPAEGQLTTDSGEAWSTSDGGKTWSRH